VPAGPAGAPPIIKCKDYIENKKYILNQYLLEISTPKDLWVLESNRNTVKLITCVNVM